MSLHTRDQERATSEFQIQNTYKLLERIAGQKHHLLGTASNPGIYSVRKIKKPLHKKLIDYRKPGFHPNVIRIPETQLEDNPILRQWIQENLQRNKKHLVKKLEEPSPEEFEKISQGPFLVIYIIYP